MKEIKITSEELDKYNALLQKDEIDFEEEGVEEDATLLSKTVKRCFARTVSMAFVLLLESRMSGL